MAAAPPVASADVDPSNGPAPLNVTLTGTGFKSGGQIVAHEWDFNGDGTYDVRITDFAKAAPDSMTFFINHATCGPNNRFDFYLNDVLMGSATGTVGCICNNLEPSFTVSGPAAFASWNPGGANTVRIVPGFDLAVG